MKKLLFGAFLALHFATRVHAVIGFDDFQPGTNWLAISNGFAGLQWTNFGVLNGTLRPVTEGYRTGVVSSNNVAFNRDGFEASISASSTFNLNSAYLTAAFVEGLEVRVLGFNGTNAAYDTSYNLSTSAPTLVNFSYAGVDRVKFIATPESQFAMDNLDVSGLPTNTAKPSVSVLVADSTAAEGDGTGQFLIRRMGASISNELTVTFSLTGAAVNGVDYSNLATSVTIPAGTSNAFVTISPVDDSQVEGTEGVTLSVSSNAAYNIASPNSATIYILDNDNQLPAVSVLNPTNGASFVGPLNLLIEAAAYDVDGSIRRVEFRRGTTLIGSVTNTNSSGFYSLIWSNASTGAYSLTAKAIDNVESVSTSAPVNITITGVTNTAKPSVTVQVTDSTAAEGDGTGQFMIRRSGASISNALTVVFSLSGAAINGVDYSNLTTSVTISAGASNAFVTISPIDDSLVEGAEGVTLMVSSNATYNISSPSSGTIYILDNDTTPPPTNNPPSVVLLTPTNGMSFTAPATILLQAAAWDDDGSVLRVEFYKGTQLIGSATNTNSLGFYAYEWHSVTNGSYAVTAKAIDNLEAFTISDVANITVTGGTTNTSKPSVTVQVTDSTAAEGDGVGQFMVRRSGTSVSNTLTVSFSLSGSAVNGVDYSNLTTSVTIPAGLSNAFVTINPTDDTLVEGPETVTLTISSNAAYNITSPSSGTITIQDNDNEPPPTNIPPSVVLLTPTNGASFTAPATILLQAAAWDGDGSIHRVEFYKGTQLIGSATNTNSLGFYGYEWHSATNGSYAVIAKAIDNLEAYTVSDVANITVSGETNNAPKPYVYVQVSDSTAAEGDGVGQFMIKRYGASVADALNVSFILTGSAVNGVDYSNLTTSVTIPAGSSNAFVTIIPTDDTLVEGPESVILTLSSNADYNLSTSSSGTITIQDNDFAATNIAPVITIITPTNGTTLPGPTNLLVQVQGTDPDGVIDWMILYIGGVQIYSTKNYGNAAVFTISTNRNFSPGVYTLLAVGADNGQKRATSAPVTLTITGSTNTVKPVVNALVSDSSAAEGGTPAGNPGRFQIKRSENITSALTVYFTLTGTAIAGTDYTNVSTAVTIPAGQTNAFIYVSPIDDEIVEGEETVILTLSSNVAYNIGTSPHANITIQDNDVASNVPPVVSITSPDEGTLFTGSSNIVIYASATDATNGWIDTVQFFAGTNSLGIVTNCPECDYIQNPFNVTWEHPQPGTYTLTAKATDNQGASTISEPVHITVISGSNSVPAQPVVTITAADSEAKEGTENTAAFTIHRTQNTNVAITVYYDILGTASNGVDYVAIPGSVNIPRGATAMNVIIRPLDDNLVEGNETVMLRLSAMDCIAVYPPPPECYLVGTPNQATAVIVDNDRIPVEPSFVSRRLPIWYVPGVKLTVELKAEPHTNSLSYVIADVPPTNWVVGLVSSNGVYDASNGIVRFTVNEGGSRTFTYEATPPSTDHGEKHFAGTVAINGAIVDVSGNKSIVQAPGHPADRVPTNFVMTSMEVSNYVHAWKSNDRWPSAPNPIPVSYVARAGYLLAHGGGYKISSSSPTPFAPLLWVATNSTVNPLDPAGSVSTAIPWTTNGLGTAVSSLPTNYSFGVPITVSITVTPGVGAAAYALEERPPVGWIVSDISDDGAYCPDTGKIRWGVFTDGISRILTYTVISTVTNIPRVAEFVGVVSFDGVNAPITGVRRTVRAISVSPPAVLGYVKLLSDGNRLWNFSGTPGICYILEGSTNLVDWEPVVELLNNDGALQFIDLATNQTHRFYRTTPKP